MVTRPLWRVVTESETCLLVGRSRGTAAAFPIRSATSIRAARHVRGPVASWLDEGPMGLLTCMHRKCIFMHMRTTLNIEESLLKQAARLTGVKEKTALVRRGLEALIALESARRLAALGGSEKKLKPAPRRRTSAA